MDSSMAPIADSAMATDQDSFPCVTPTPAMGTIDFASMPTLSSLLLADDEDESPFESASSTVSTTSRGANRHPAKMGVGRRQRQHRRENRLSTKPMRKAKQQRSIGKEVDQLMSAFSRLMREASDIKNVHVRTEYEMPKMNVSVGNEVVLYSTVSHAFQDVGSEYSHLSRSTSAITSDTQLGKELNPAVESSNDDDMRDLARELKELTNTIHQFQV